MTPDDAKLVEQARDEDANDLLRAAFERALDYVPLVVYDEARQPAERALLTLLVQRASLADAVERLSGERDGLWCCTVEDHEEAVEFNKGLWARAKAAEGRVRELERERDEARVAARAEGERADVMQHERDWEQEVVSADLYNRLEAAEGRVRQLEHERDFWKQRYDTQHGTVHRLEDSLEAARAESEEAVGRVRQLEAALERVQENALSWHGPEPPGSGHVKALTVIAQWCCDALAAVSQEGAP